MRAGLLTAWTWLDLVTAITLPQRTHERLGLHQRASDTDFFPFPANKSSIVDEKTQPSDSPPQNLTVNLDQSAASASGQIPRHFIETKCDASKKEKIMKAWAEADLLAKAQTNFQLGYNYDIPHTQWLGKDWNSESSWIPWRYNYRKLIGANFGRLAQLFSNHAQSGEYIYWYCYDYSRECSDGTQAYSWDSLGAFWSNHYTVFCEPFYYERSNMEDQINKYANNEHEQKVMENFELSRGQIMFHEIWHYKDLVSSPRTGDYAYQSQRVWDLAKNKGTGWSYVNADSYALDAVAIYVQQHYKSGMSPVPWRELAELDAVAAAAVSQPPTNNATARTFGTEPPPGWVAPSSTDGSPDLSLWTEVFLDGSQSSQPAQTQEADKNDCHGISGDYWVMSRDVAVDNVKDFCGQTDPTKTYNVGSVNELELSVQKVGDDTQGPQEAPDCIARFQNAVIDGCDGADPVNNPHNYKFGSTLTTTDGWQYKMTPLSKQVNEVSCDVSYKFFFDSFEIRGKNLPDAKFGANGEGLRKELSGCGVLTKWGFERTLDDCCFQWYATGQLPVGTKNCIGNALESAGGSGNGNCHGAGKRGVGHNSIDDWPGYGDNSKHIFAGREAVKRDSIDRWPGYSDESRHVFEHNLYHS